MSDKIFIIYHGRFPSEKAAALFTAKNAEAFSDAGKDVTVLVPRRLGRNRQSYSDYFGIQKNFKTVFLPVIDLFPISFLDKLAFITNFLTFSLSCLFFFFFKASKKDIIYSNESLPLFFISFFFPKIVYEIHDFPKAKRFFYEILLKRIWKIVVTNHWKKTKLMQEFNIPEKKLLYESNAVDLKQFSVNLSQEDARKKLSLPQDKFILTYVGMLKTMGMEKGIDTVFSALKLLDDKFILLLIGGSQSDLDYYKKLSEKEGIKNRIIFAGFVKNSEVPIYLKASDVLLAPFPKNDHYEFYMSPMKIFEYMASSRPIIASDLVSIKEIAGGTAIYVPPSDKTALAGAILGLKDNPALASEMAQKALNQVSDHTWQKRAERIIDFLYNQD